ncbi:Eukaryotic translation initiation factor 4H, partial [Zancudomyces culisetae]
MPEQGGGSSWADDEYVLPSAHRRQGEKHPLPTEPPFTAFLDSLPYDSSREDLERLFGADKITEIKLLQDKNSGQFKGSALVIFNELEDLKEALTHDGAELNGRRIRVNVAEPRRRMQDHRGRGGRDDDRMFTRQETEAETADSWRMHKEQPQSDHHQQFRQSGSRGPRRLGEQMHTEAEKTTNWRENMGGDRFVPHDGPDSQRSESHGGQDFEGRRRY